MTPAPRRIKAKVTARRPGGWAPLRSRLLSWVSVGLVLFNTLAMLVLPPGAPTHGGVAAGRIVVCTAAGLVEWTLDGSPVPGETSGHSDVCVNCLPLISALPCCPPGAQIQRLEPVAAEPVRQDGMPNALAVHRPAARSPPAA